jgi:GPH family glycoside/pentoside/hexuronide:cation symporter
MPVIKASLKDKLFYAFGNMGSYILWAFIGTYMTIYVTECLQPGDAMISLLGTIVLVCRFFDALSDILMGVIVEKTHSKLGKGRLWFGISIIPMLIIFFFIFYLTNLDKTTAIIVISVLYFLFTVVFYTMNGIGFNAMLPRLSNDPYDQSNICTINSIFTSVGSLVTAIAIPVLLYLGGDEGEASQQAWTIFVLILAALAFVGEALCFFFVKENPAIVVDDKKSMSHEQFRSGMAALFRCKYFYIAIAMFVLNYYLSFSVVGIGKYYAQYVLGDEKAFSVFGSVPMITMGIGLLSTPFLVKKIGKKNTFVAAVSCVVLGNLIGACAPASYAAAFTGVMVKGLGSAVVMSQLYTLAPDMVRYIDAKTGVRVEGLAASANSFGCKIGSGLGAAIVLWLIPLCGYVAGQDSQNQGALTMFTALYWWMPLGLSALLLLLACFWNIEKDTKAIEAKKIPAVPDSKLIS